MRSRAIGKKGVEIVIIYSDRWDYLHSTCRYQGKSIEEEEKQKKEGEGEAGNCVIIL